MKNANQIVETKQAKRAIERATNCAVESLELRRMLSASVALDHNTGTINITGTSGNDHLEFWCADWGQRVMEYQANNVSGGLYSGTEPYLYKTINIYGLGGKDTIDLSECPIGMDINIYPGATTGDTVNVGPGPDSGESGNWAKIHFNGAAGGNSTVNYRLAGYPVKDRVQATVASDRVTLGSASSSQGIFFQGVSTINVNGNDQPYDVRVNSVAANQSLSLSGDSSYYWVGKPPYANYNYQIGNGNVAANIKGKLSIDGGRGASDKVIFDDSSSGGNVDTLGYEEFYTAFMSNHIKFANTEQLTVFGSQNNDVINIQNSDSATNTINVNAAAGNDVINVGGYGLDPVMTATLNVDGFSGNDDLIANDSQHAGPTGYILSSGKFKRDSNATWNFAGLERFDLQTGSGNSFVNGYSSNVPLGITCGGGSDTVYGSANNDTFHGGAGNDNLYGNNGNDDIDGGTGADYMSGGAGIDLADYSSRTNGVTIGLNNAGGDGEANENDNVVSDFEQIAGGSGADHLYLHLSVAGSLYGNGGNDTLVGSNFNDSLYGGAGNDLLKAGLGNDYIDAGIGQDKLSGGDGNDTLVSSDSDVDTLDGGIGTNSYFKDLLDVMGVVA